MAINNYRVENRDYEADDLVGAVPADGKVESHRRRIEPWLSAIFQSEYLNLLVGSGFSLGLALSAGAKGASMAPTAIDPGFDAAIGDFATAAAKAMDRGKPNIEDQFRAALALQAGLDVLKDPRRNGLRAGLSQALAAFANGVLSMEAAIHAATDDERFKRLLSEFLLSFASRTATRDRLHVFTTNYDRLIEHGFDLIGARPMDRFVGALSPRFRASRFDVDIHYTPPGGRADARPLEGVARFTKLHGSIDWTVVNGEIVRRAIPFGGPHNFAPPEAEGLMVFPNSSKDVETAFFPYAELFRDFSAAVCRPNAALVTYGYGFGDDHVNRIIRDMLTLPSTHLVILSFDGAGGRIERFVNSCGRPAQVSSLIGSQLAALDPLVDHFLPKPAIDTITQRQTALLERRGRSVDAPPKGDPPR